MNAKEIIKRFFPDIYLIKYNRYMDAKIKRNQILKNLSFDEKVKELHNIYFRKLGRQLNLENPRDWNEKMQWLKLFDSTREKSEWTDKIKAKSLAASRIGDKYIVPMLCGGG